MVTDAREPVRSYPIPAAGNTIAEDFARLALALTAIGVDVGAILSAVAGKADESHKHQLADVVGLVTALANKAEADHAHALGGLSDVDTAGANVYQVLAKTLDGKWRPWTIDLINVIGAAAFARIDGATFTGATKVPTAPTTADSTNAVNVTMLRAAIAALVASSPATLDTLNELAAALGNDPNFATTMATALGGKANKATKLKVGGGLSLDGVTGSAEHPIEADLSSDRLIELVSLSLETWKAGSNSTPAPISPVMLAAAVQVLAGGALPRGIVEISTSGGYKPSAGTKYILAILRGGGGGAAGANGSSNGGGGGGEGAMGIALIPVDPATTYAVTIGAGGPSVSARNNGYDGGSTSIVVGGVTYLAGGGGGGYVNGTYGSGGSPGAACILGFVGTSSLLWRQMGATYGWGSGPSQAAGQAGSQTGGAGSVGHATILEFGS